ncbi:MAG: energy transducer TonB [Cyclobacteriaceae bacterium]|nr:energy transducer TonB [Cyclobacteriaceae bacterium]UYN85435.1 MAG: energy transducer TonB [Cyclobacteriaceae bacterium]
MGLFHEPKKTNHADLERIRPVIFNISLIITLLLVIAAFEWRTAEKVEQKVVALQTSDFEEVMDVPQTEIPPPPPPVLQQPRIVEVPNQEEIKEEIKVQFDIDVTNTTVSQEFTIETAPVVQVEEEETDKIFLVVEQSAAPKGGMAAFYDYVSKNINYPAQARRMNIEGKVFVEFVVDKDGTLTNFVVVKGIGAGCDEEALRIIQSAPPWTPAKQRGKPVRQRMVLPIYFKLAARV